MTIELINQLIDNMNDDGIVYCHWKSNFYLAESLSGEIDLDLLVDRQSLSRALLVLENLGFKPAIMRSGMITPGIYHYYGLDSQTGRLIHVHLYNRVLTGESFVKSHQLPLERMLFENVYDIDRIKVTSKPAELVLFILRIFIKYGSILDLIRLIGKSEEIRDELHWLLAGGDGTESLVLLKKYCPVIDEQLFCDCIVALNKKSSLVKRILLAWRVRKQLRVYAKNDPIIQLFAYFQFLWEEVMRRLGGYKRNKSLCAGGAVVAFIGPEATGKSTLVSETKKWLGQVFVVRTIHAGKPPSSWLTAPVNIVLPFVRRLWPRFRSSRLEGHGSEPDQTRSSSGIEGFSGIIYALRAVSLAWDRRRLLVKARRLAASNEIVVCDRYPSGIVGAMDSPRLQENQVANDPAGVIFSWLARLEHRLYREIPPPDVVLKLNVSVETAKKRNRERIKVGKETDAYLESRHRLSLDWCMPGTKYIYDIDTEQTLVETIFKVKQSIWESL
jgi:thymidylate kinase